MSEEQLEGVFESDAGDGTVAGARSLEGTAKLTQVSNDVVSGIIRQLNGNMDVYTDRVIASQKSHGAMDELIKELGDLESVDVEFIRELPEETVNAMLKSQQSKRSRTKGKTMTLDNYRSMMVGAVAENLIRIATGKTKLAGGARRAAGDIGFSDEQLAFLADNQDELKRELRNIQSKKSIAKSKEGFSEEDEYWQKLLAAEAQLKSVRVSGGRTKIVEVDKTKDAVSDLLENAGSMSKKELLAKLEELTGDATPDEEPTEE